MIDTTERTEFLYKMMLLPMRYWDFELQMHILNYYEKYGTGSDMLESAVLDYWDQIHQSR